MNQDPNAPAPAPIATPSISEFARRQGKRRPFATWTRATWLIWLGTILLTSVLLTVACMLGQAAPYTPFLPSPLGLLVAGATAVTLLLLAAVESERPREVEAAKSAGPISRKRERSRRRSVRRSMPSTRGFTIVELLVVIVAIAILAAITIVAYNGVTRRAVETTMKSDLQSNASGVEVDKARDGSYPADGSEANQGEGLKSSGANRLTYVEKPYGYCIEATNPQSDKTYVVKSSSGEVTEGTCEVAVATTAGSASGFKDGDATDAQFSYYALAVDVDTSGNIYVADAGNYRIRKITPAGVVSTFAGSGTSGYVDGPGETAQFAWMSDLAVDAAGNVYVTEGGRIRKVTPTGVVSTLTSNITDRVDVGTDGVVYTYGSGNRVDKISSSGTVSTLAGSGAYGYLDGSGVTARFANTQSVPLGGDVAVAKDGTVYVADAGNYRIRKITLAGDVSTFAGSGTSGYVDGPGETAQFVNPQYIAVDSGGTLYVADGGTGLNRIRTITPAGVVSTLAGSATSGYLDGSGETAQFGIPRGIAVDAPGTAIYVTDGARIRKITQ